MVVGVARWPWSVVGRLGCARRSDSSAQVLSNSRSEFSLLAPLAMDVFIFPSVFLIMARMVILYSGNVLDGTKSQCCMVSWSVVGV